MKYAHSLLLSLATVLGVLGLSQTASSDEPGFVGCECNGYLFESFSYHDLSHYAGLIGLALGLYAIVSLLPKRRSDEGRCSA